MLQHCFKILCRSLDHANLVKTKKSLAANSHVAPANPPLPIHARNPVAVKYLEGLSPAVSTFRHAKPLNRRQTTTSRRPLQREPPTCGSETFQDRNDSPGRTATRLDHFTRRRALSAMPIIPSAPSAMLAGSGTPASGVEIMSYVGGREFARFAEAPRASR